VITLWTINKQGKVFVGADALGERGLRAEKVDAKAAKKLLSVLDSETIVDCHLADNLIPLLALVGGEIKTDKITGHIRSNIYVCEKFLDVKFLINEEKYDPKNRASVQYQPRCNENDDSDMGDNHVDGRRAAL